MSTTNPEEEHHYGRDEGRGYAIDRAGWSDGSGGVNGRSLRRGRANLESSRADFCAGFMRNDSRNIFLSKRTPICQPLACQEEP